MRFIADLHIHSKYSRATSRDLDLEHLSRWAQLKGITVVGTGDFTHPGWFAELREKLVPAEDGLFRLRDDLAAAIEPEVPAACRRPVRFLLQVEISNIYKKGDRVRKVHNLVYMPDFDAAERFRRALARIGNLDSDGRPILGLDSRDLLEITLSVSERAYLIPAHIWTPWFSALGARSGFDSIEECFGDLAEHIFAVETGLSSDPPMNWRLSGLDRYTLVSNSDAHSPGKLGREAVVFDTELSYDGIRDALRSGRAPEFLGTVEFFPEEGKYHYDGHRACGVRLAPEEAEALEGRCPVCGRSVTRGVLSRVEELADRPAGARPDRAAPYRSLIPLPEVLAEVRGVGVGARAVERDYARLLGRLGSELEVLEAVPLEDIERQGGPLVAEAVRRVRAGEVRIAAGYDGEYGTIRLFEPGERERFGGQTGISLAGAEVDLFGGAVDSGAGGGKAKRREASRRRASEPVARVVEAAAPYGSTDGLDPDQRRAVEAGPGPLLVLAGPGTGKTRVLTHRIAHIVERLGVAPERVLAVTFTNRAAGEMAERLAALLGAGTAERVAVRTFHGFGLEVLGAEIGRLGRAPDFEVFDEEAAQRVLTEATGVKGAEARRLADAIARAKERLLAPEEVGDPELAERYRAYQAALEAAGGVDYDDLIRLTVAVFRTAPDVLERWRARVEWLLIDEYQDVSGAQYELVRLLAPPEAGSGRGPNLTAVGDPDQAIYGFRGADPRYVRRFTEDYPTATVVRLRQNYRSTSTILRAARQVVTGGRDDTEEVLRARGRPAGEPIVVYEAPTEAAEAETIVHAIERMVGGTSLFSLDSGRVESDAAARCNGFGEVAVLYRTHAQARALEEAFARSGIPYQRVSTPPDESEPFDPRAERVALMTLHAAKGLEFPVVFIAGCEEGLLPYQPPGDAKEVDEGEERRLFYVGLTRAQRRLILTRARRRVLYGQYREPGPSPFLGAIDPALLAVERWSPPRRERDQQLQLFGE
ncbi:MAG TPA: UvrD-helicase domain-containing protein [Longimicrobiales bacterium]